MNEASPGQALEGAILAAGRGERLRSRERQLPKPLVQLGGRALLARQAAAMLKAGATRVRAIVNSETAQMVAKQRIALPDALSLCVRDTSNSMESLFALGEGWRPSWFLMSTVDAVVATVELDRFAKAGLDGRGSPGFDGMLALVRWRGDARPLFAKVDSSGAIVDLGADREPLVTAGFYFLPGRIFEFVRAARDARLGALRDFLEFLIRQGLRLKAFEMSGAIDIDEAHDLAAAEAMVRADR